MERESINIKPLSLRQRILRGIVTSTLESAIAVLEGIVLFHYNDKKKVSTEYLSLSNFVVGVLIVFVSIAVGNMSDRSKGRYRRKTYIMFFVPLYVVGTFFRFGAFTSNEAAPLYYAVTYAIQIVGRSGMSITNDAWNMELANEEVDRGNLYATVSATGVFGILIGLGLTSVPLVYSGTLLALSTVIFNIFNVVMIPEGTPMSKRCFIPTVTNISSVMWNSQYRIYLATLTWVWFINSIPGLLLFFLRYCLHLSENAAEAAYTMCLAGFIFTGFCALPCIPKIIASKGKKFAASLSLLGLMVLGPIFFAVSYVDKYLTVIVFGIVGFFATMSNTIFNIIAADVVDYDELLTGMKRAASYTAVTNLPFMFVSVAGSSIPFAMMSALGFEEPGDDDDKDDDDSGNSTQGSTAVLRVWCSLFVGLIGLVSFAILRSYKIGNEVHIQILENIFSREPVRGLDNTSEMASDSEFAVSPLTKDEVVDDEEIPKSPEPVGLKLEATDDPVTGGKVCPPPYVITLHASNTVLAESLSALCESEQTTVRLLGYYFPSTISLCATYQGRQRLLAVAISRFVLYLTLLILGIWQTVMTIIRHQEFGSYLMVVLSALYSFFLAWEVLFFKGLVRLHHLDRSENRVAIQECLDKIGERIKKEKASSDAGDLEHYVTTFESMLKSAIATSAVLVLSFVGAYLALNL